MDIAEGLEIYPVWELSLSYGASGHVPSHCTVPLYVFTLFTHMHMRWSPIGHPIASAEVVGSFPH